MKKHFLRLATVTLFLLSTSIPASTATVRDRNAQGLPGCDIRLGPAQTRSSADGTFDIGPATRESADVSSTLEVRCPGYAPRFVELGDGKSLPADITVFRPNFIFLLSDDQGWVQTSTQMDPDDPSTKSDYFKTPNIDRFFEGGMLFGRGYSPGTYCMPTRRAIQVARSPLWHAFNGRPVEQWTAEYKTLPSIPRVLKAADPDYRAAHFGKWDLRYDDPDPAELGYDESDGPTGNGAGNQGAFVNGKLDKRTARPAEDPKNIFDLTRRGSEFMQKQVESGHPFYLQLSHYALHLSIFYRQQTYDEVKQWPVGEKHYIPSFASLLKDMDEGFGLLFDTVRELGIEDHTYIIYMGDNGGRATLNLSDGRSRERRNEPLSEGKHSIYEGGIRVPFGMSGPGIEPGSYTRTAVSGVDILPTIADLVNADVVFRDVDGGSLAPLVFGQSETVERPNPFLVFHDKSANPKSSDKKGDSESAIMQGDYKLIRTWRNGRLHTTELYDLARDPGEANDLAADLPEKVASLGAMLDAYIAHSGGDVTIDNDDWP